MKVSFLLAVLFFVCSGSVFGQEEPITLNCNHGIGNIVFSASVCPEEKTTNANQEYQVWILSSYKKDRYDRITKCRYKNLTTGYEAVCSK